MANFSNKLPMMVWEVDLSASPPKFAAMKRVESEDARDTPRPSADVGPRPATRRDFG